MRAPSLPVIGSLASALASSACCWLPLLMLAFGLSATGAAAFLERFRLLFLILAGFLLAVGFYFSYRPKRMVCGPDGRCSFPDRKLRRWNRGMLWLSTLLVGAFASFPGYVGTLLGAPGESAPTSVAAEVEAGRLHLEIDGLTCSGCESIVEAALSKVPGVLGSTVSHEAGTAVVRIDPRHPPTAIAVGAAVGEVGYRVTEMTREY